MDIDEGPFQECFVNSKDKLLALSWEICDHVAQSALFKMETAAHAVAARTFDTFFSAWARKIHDPLFSLTGKTTFRSQTRSKKADISWTLKGYRRADLKNGRHLLGILHGPYIVPSSKKTSSSG
ncbi:hypothetical protein N7478_011112 [Penicillium angulare]|uniref:uncharacterized protein n=1 Tax=Penicillium angulare TaxID=116970 RepID=UPI00254007A5|nr:uncharacterized protein N7478_011112 [Penicillium angulare]KAJ5263507.1 hypothetical protein N7478_011112 [Penicillium angulare]